MSGICGIVVHDRQRRLAPDGVVSMLEGLREAGEAEESTVVRGGTGLGARGVPGQLSGVSELTVHGRAVAIAFYGCLYNGAELSAGEARDADRLRVLLQLYLRHGMAFVQELRGDFALAVWDGSEETLHLASDRFRVHPLFYYEDGEYLVFASRMKAILGCSIPLSRSINLEAVVDVVASSTIPTPKTIFKEVKKLPPGYILSSRNGEIRLSRYWDIDFREPSKQTKGRLSEELKDVFSDALSVRLKGDQDFGTIGTFLSGGVDSSTVTGVLTQLAKCPIKSFSIGFEEQGFNEISYARIAAKAFNVEHHEYFVSPQDTYGAIPVLLDSFDEPFGNASAIPTYFCARLARDHGVSVLYAGDGGDELFAGNERYATQRLFDWYQKIPVWCRRRVAEPWVFFLADRTRHKLLLKAKKYIQRANIPYPERLTSYGVLRIIPMAEMFDDSLLDTIGRGYDPYAPVGEHYYQAPARSELDRQLYVDLKLAISDNDLLKVTRMAAAAGVTVRFPFLDHRLSEFAAKIPAEIKMPGRELRRFFKNAYADLLPLEMRTKTKHGFGLPIPYWLKTDLKLKEMMYDLLLSPVSVQRGYFKREALERLVDRHRNDQTSFYGTVIWNLMVIELWHRHHWDKRKRRDGSRSRS